MIKVAIVDDKPINRQSIRERILMASGMQILFMADNGSTFLEKMKTFSLNDDFPDVVLMDIDMPIMNGIAAVNIAKELYPKVDFLMLTIFDDDEKIFEAIKSGASGYLLKEESMEKLAEAVLQVKEFGAVAMSPIVARKAMMMLSKNNNSQNIGIQNNAKDDYNLTEREIEIIKGMVEGLDYRQIGEKLFVSPHTVRTHIGNIYKKLHVCSKVDAVKIAIKRQWF
ncbi:MAG: response regulator transcription factor [Saprospiraceae bacterium]